MEAGEELTKDVFPPFVSDDVDKFLEFLFKIMTQLRVISGMATTVVGFDYLAVIETAKIYKYELSSKKMDLLRVAEKIVINSYNKKSEGSE